MGCSGSKQQTAAATPAKVPEGDFKVTLERAAEEAIGLSIVQTTEKTYRVNGVKEAGLVPDWNKKNENTPDVLVKENDLIVAVNGVFGDLEAMSKELTAQKVTMAIKRPEVAAPAAEATPAEAAPAADADAAAAGAAATDAAAAVPAAETGATDKAAEPPAEPAPAAAEGEAAAPAEAAAAAEPVAQTTEGAAPAAEAAETTEKAAEPVAEPVAEPGVTAESAEEANASTAIVDAGDLENATDVAPETQRCGFC